MEAGVGNGGAALRISFLDREGALVMVHFSHHDGLLPLEVFGVHIDANGGLVAVHALRRGHLNKFVMALGDIGYRDGAVGLDLLSADDLAVSEDQKNSSRKGAVTLIHFLQLDLDLAGILKDEAYVMLPVPHKGLLDFADIGAEDESLRRGDLLREKAALGEIGKIQILLQNIAAVLGGVLPKETAAVVQLHAGDAYDRAGDAHGGVVRVNFSNGAGAGVGGAGALRLIVESEGVGHRGVGHHRHCLRSGLGHIAIRYGLFRDEVLAGGEAIRFS